MCLGYLELFDDLIEIGIRNLHVWQTVAVLGISGALQHVFRVAHAVLRALIIAAKRRGVLEIGQAIVLACK